MCVDASFKTDSSIGIKLGRLRRSTFFDLRLKSEFSISEAKQKLEIKTVKKTCLKISTNVIQKTEHRVIYEGSGFSF
jgi:hypothetical protein